MVRRENRRRVLWVLHETEPLSPRPFMWMTERLTGQVSGYGGDTDVAVQLKTVAGFPLGAKRRGWIGWTDGVVRRIGEDMDRGRLALAPLPRRRHFWVAPQENVIETTAPDYQTRMAWLLEPVS